MGFGVPLTDVPQAKVLVAVSATAALRDGIRVALEGRRFAVLELEPTLEVTREHPGVLVVCEVTTQTEPLAQALLESAPQSPLVFIGPPGVEGSTQRANVRELSADVSVAEIVRVCEVMAFGEASSEHWNTPVSQPSLPYAVLPKGADVGAVVQSIPAPLLPSSLPPSSGRPGAARRLNLSPGLEGTLGEDPNSALTREVSPELSRLLADAETRVARTLHQRRNTGTSDAPGPSVSLSAEVMAALEDPIGDYEVMSPSSQLEPLPSNPMRGVTDVVRETAMLKSEPASADDYGPPAASEGSRPAASSPSRSQSTMPPSRPARDRAAGPGLSSRTNASSTRARPPESNHAEGAGTDRAPDSVELPGLEVAGDEQRVASVPVSSEPTTAPPPRPSDERVTVRPSRALSPIPPAPGVPRGSWVNAAVAPGIPPSDGPRANRSRSNVPTSPLPNVPPSEEASHRDTAAIEPPTRQPPSPVNEVPGVPKELPPLRQPGDAVTALASAVRLHFTGAVAFEADGGIRRVVMRDGDFSTAASSLGGESLVSFLVRGGHLPPEVEGQLGHRLPSLGRHAGAALVAAGHLAQDELWSVLRAHAEFIIARIAAISSGVAAFESEVPARLRAEPSVFGGATGSEILIETLRRVVNPAQALERMGGQSVQLRRAGNFDLVDECALSATERGYLESIFGVSLGEALSGAPSEEFVCVLYALTTLRVLEATPGMRKQAQPDKAVVRDHLDDEALRAAIATRRRLIENGDYFAILGVSKDATGYDIKSAYLSLRRQFEPSRVLTTATLDLKGDIQLVLDVISEAYDILSDQLRRERYRRAIESAPL